ncbi:glycosyltransferase family 4 protein [Stenomitos frigidus]|uniref:Group 1 glycosyl transferase n=1 Tax=Stenomitos frigidus ULC18 TaxID=2107698 RepID=A0A2T1E687_9CYAN|nr:glycosyltransferase family 4 protein [Stenomitos frigidus]PSB28262.1 group 1 glycosyl transferase [Stenomitos frigidus ULC18]
MTSDKPRVLIVAEHASAKFGGEAALPLHYFRVLRKRQIEAWLVVHERTRDELQLYFGDDFDRIFFVPDTIMHRLLWRIGQFLPQRLAYFTIWFPLRLLTQFVQRRLVKQIVQSHQITVVHQPIPVSPKEPSLIFDVGAPVIIGPMNGDMNYPPDFQWMQSRLVYLTLNAGRFLSNWLNWLIPGKRRAAILLVANTRTRAALPNGTCSDVVKLHENGVDLSVWQPKPEKPTQATRRPPNEPSSQSTKFIFVGRLVHWKAVNLLLTAFAQVAQHWPVELEIIGDGPESISLQQQAKALGLLSLHKSQSGDQTKSDPVEPYSSVRFLGWLSQADCAQRLQQSDVMVLPSMLECGGAVILESMAMGVPVIATNWGGPSDYLNESCGILIEPRSQQSFVNDLAAAMIQMAASPALRRSMGQMARHRVMSHFDWDVKVDAILDIYRDVLKATLPTRPLISPENTGSAISRV